MSQELKGKKLTGHLQQGSLLGPPPQEVRDKRRGGTGEKGGINKKITSWDPFKVITPVMYESRERKTITFDGEQAFSARCGDEGYRFQSQRGGNISTQLTQSKTRTMEGNARLVWRRRIDGGG